MQHDSCINSLQDLMLFSTNLWQEIFLGNINLLNSEAASTAVVPSAVFNRHLCISQIEASTSPPPPRAYPGHLMSYPAREGGNLINFVFPGAGI